MEIPRHVLCLQVVQGCAKSQKPRGRKTCTSQPLARSIWWCTKGPRSPGGVQPRSPLCWSTGRLRQDKWGDTEHGCPWPGGDLEQKIKDAGGK